MGLVRLVLRHRGRVLPVLTGGQPAAGAVPHFGDLNGRVLREAGPGFVPGSAPIRHKQPRRGFTTLRLSHRARTNAGTPDRTCTSDHEFVSLKSDFVNEVQ